MAIQVLRLVVVLGFLALSATAAGAPSPNPYTASLAYARCLRAHGVPHPLPDAKGNFRLTPAEEQRLRTVPRTTRKAADNACFHYLKALNCCKILDSSASACKVFRSHSHTRNRAARS